MTLSVICDKNLRELQWSFKQPGRTHTYGRQTVTGICKVGDYFQLQLSSGQWFLSLGAYSVRTDLHPGYDQDKRCGICHTPIYNRARILTCQACRHQERQRRIA